MQSRCQYSMWCITLLRMSSCISITSGSRTNPKEDDLVQNVKVTGKFSLFLCIFAQCHCFANMEYQTTEARQLAGLKPVDGVYKLESALEKISVSLLEVSDSSAAHHELQSLHQTYTKYRDEAKELRQKGMASFRKYLAAKNGGHPPSSTPTSSTTRPTTSSTRAAATNTPNNTSNNSVPHRSPNGSSNATQINININNPQSGATATQMSQMSSNTSISTNNAPPPPPSRRSPVRSEQRSQSNPNPNAVAIQQLTKQVMY